MSTHAVLVSAVDLSYDLENIGGVTSVAFDFRDAVFSDDFESGGTTAWSGTTP